MSKPLRLRGAGRARHGRRERDRRGGGRAACARAAPRCTSSTSRTATTCATRLSWTPRSSGCRGSTCSSAAAGVGGDSLHTEEVSDEEWGRVHAINLNGVFFANRAAIPKMKAGGYGRIVNIASIAGKEGNPMAGAYSSSKGAVIGAHEGDRQGRRRQRDSRQLHRARGHQHADPRPDLRGAHRVHDRADPARARRRAGRGGRARSAGLPARR